MLPKNQWYNKKYDFTGEFHTNNNTCLKGSNVQCLLCSFEISHESYGIMREREGNSHYRMKCFLTESFDFFVKWKERWVFQRLMSVISKSGC